MKADVPSVVASERKSPWWVPLAAFWVQCATAFFGVATLGAFVYGGYSQRWHDRMTVRPSLSIFLRDSPGKEPLSFHASNTGLGPAIYRWMIVYVDDKAFTPTDQKSWLPVFDAIGAEKGLRGGGWFNPGDQIARGTSHGILEQSVSFDNQMLMDARTAIRSVRFELCYCSIYDECWVARHNVAAPSTQTCDPTS